jgi:hypothetical protein
MSGPSVLSIAEKELSAIQKRMAPLPPPLPPAQESSLNAALVGGGGVGGGAEDDVNNFLCYLKELAVRFFLVLVLALKGTVARDF